MNAADRHTNRSKAKKALTGEAPNRAAKRLGAYHMLTLTKPGPGSAALEIMTPQDGTPRETVRRNADGTIDHVLDGERVTGPVIRDRKHLVKDLERLAESLLIEELAAGEDSAAFFAALTEPKEARIYRRAVRRKAVEMAEASCGNSSSLKPRRLTTEANKAVFKWILTHRHWTYPAEHNWMLAHPLAADRLRNDAPGLLALLMTQLNGREEQQPTAEELVKRLKQTAGLSESELDWLKQAAEANCWTQLPTEELATAVRTGLTEGINPLEIWDVRQVARAANQEKETDRPHREDAHYRRTTAAIDELTAAVAPVTQRTTLLDVSNRKQEKTLAILESNGRPKATLTRSPEGTLHWQMDGAPVERPVLAGRGEFAAAALDVMKADIAGELIRALGPEPEILTEITSPEGAQALTAGAKRALKNQSRAGEGEPEGTTYNTLTTAANKIIRREFADAQVIQLAERIEQAGPTARTPLDTRRYNLVARNYRALQAIAETHLHLAVLWYSTVPTGGRESAAHRHPGQIVSDLREELKVPERTWKVLCRIRECITSQYQTDIARGAKTAATALADTNVPLDTRYRRRMAAHTISLMRRHDEFARLQGWTHGNPWRAWTNALAGYLTDEGPARENWTALMRIADALRGHLTQDLPWSAGNWETLKNRADRWHENNHEPGPRYRKGDDDLLAASSWENTLAETAAGDFTATPLTSGLQLSAAARRLDNCAENYCQSCLDGTSRIYTLTADGEAETMVELIPGANGWKVGQLEGAGRAVVPASAREAARILAQKHTEAERRTAASRRGKIAPVE